jgi:hypothetical protein
VRRAAFTVSVTSTARGIGHRPFVRFMLALVHLAGADSPHTRREQELLARYASGKQRVLELGVEQGAGTAILRRSMRPGGVLYAVDPHPSGRFGVSFPLLVARLVVGRVKNGDVRWMRMTADRAAEALAQNEPRGFDLIVSDHRFDYEGLKAEWPIWRGSVAPGGIFIQSTSIPLHPRTSEGHGTVLFTRDVLLRDPEFECINSADTFTVFERRGSTEARTNAMAGYV